MNKTLLLIICDFLLLNLLALTRWEKAEPTRPQQEAPVPTAAANMPPRDQDLVELMRLSLEDERSTREQLSAQLQQSQTALQTREESLEQLQTAKTQVESSLESARQNVQELDQRVALAAQNAATTQEQMEKLRRELEQRQSELERRQQRVAALEKEQTEARQRIENLNVAVKVAEQEKVLLRDTLQETKQQVEAEREERQKVMARTGELAEGVGRLAETSGEIAQEIRESRPINANTIFTEFMANRVFTAFNASRGSFFGRINRAKETKTVLVTDGKAVYALVHARDTPFPVTAAESPVDWERVTGQFGRAPVTAPVREFQFLSLDPRIVVIPVDPDLAARLGVKVYETALEPFKFSEAVLVSNGGAGYGEVPFKLDPQTPQYVRMDNRFIKRLVGNFTASAGDLVFSKTGELIGLMVNDDYCALIDNFLPAKTITTGESTAGQRTGQVLAQLISRLHRLPFRLQ